MNITEYISSGILESYVLGEVSDKERSEIESNLLLYPELREELVRVEEAQEILLMRTSITPPKNIKQRILSSVEDRSIPDRQTKIIPLSTPTSLKWWQLATAASVSIALITSYYAWDYRGQLSSTKQNLNDLRTQNQQIAQDYNIVNQRLDNIENTIKIIDNPSYKRVIMRGTATAQNSIASVYWNESTSELYMSIQNLRELSQGKQYQLWAIVDGKPVDAGIFTLAAGLIKMKEVRNASAFAVTVEPSGGSSSPTLSSMQVIGTIGS